jgi:hypothetical protein
VIIETLVQAAFDALPRRVRRSIYGLLLVAVVIGLAILLIKAT